jgi:hypothetical protein
MLNLFQILSKHLTIETIIRLNTLYPNKVLENVLIHRLGFLPMKIDRYLVGEYYIFRGSTIIFHFTDNCLHVYTNKYTSVQFQITQDNNMFILNAYYLTFAKLKDLRTLIKQLKISFIEFAIKKCVIRHLYNVRIEIHTFSRSGNSIITLPGYVNSNLIEAVL